MVLLMIDAGNPAKRNETRKERQRQSTSGPLLYPNSPPRTDGSRQHVHSEREAAAGVSCHVHALVAANADGL